MKLKELRDKSREELETLLMDTRAKLNQLRFDVSARQVKNYKEINQSKKEIARILTLLKSK